MAIKFECVNCGKNSVTLEHTPIGIRFKCKCGLDVGRTTYSARTMIRKSVGKENVRCPKCRKQAIDCSSDTRKDWYCKLCMHHFIHDKGKVKHLVIANATGTLSTGE